MLQRERIKLEATRRVGIPVLTQSRTTRRDLDNRNRRVNLFSHSPAKAELRSEEILSRLQRDPTLRRRHLLPPHLVREQDVLLRLIQTRKRRETRNIHNPRMRADHVRLPGKDEDAHRFTIGIGTKGRQWRQ